MRKLGVFIGGFMLSLALSQGSAAAILCNSLDQDYSLIRSSYNERCSGRSQTRNTAVCLGYLHRGISLERKSIRVGCADPETRARMRLMQQQVAYFERLLIAEQAEARRRRAAAVPAPAKPVEADWTGALRDTAVQCDTMDGVVPAGC